ncbi:hypothetical protein NEAUS03_1867, partial [Nematocida ausubeli]
MNKTRRKLSVKIGFAVVYFYFVLAARVNATTDDKPETEKLQLDESIKLDIPGFEGKRAISELTLEELQIAIENVKHKLSILYSAHPEETPDQTTAADTNGSPIEDPSLPGDEVNSSKQDDFLKTEGLSSSNPSEGNSSSPETADLDAPYPEEQFDNAALEEKPESTVDDSAVKENENSLTEKDLSMDDPLNEETNSFIVDEPTSEKDSTVFDPEEGFKSEDSTEELSEVSKSSLDEANNNAQQDIVSNASKVSDSESIPEVVDESSLYKTASEEGLNQSESKPVTTDEFTQSEPLLSDETTQSDPVTSDETTQYESLLSDETTQSEPVLSDESISQSESDPAKSDETTQSEPVLSDETTQSEPTLSDETTQSDPVTSDESISQSESDPLLSDESISQSESEPMLSDETTKSDEFTQSEPVLSDETTQSEPMLSDETTQSDEFTQSEPVLSDETTQSESMLSDEGIEQPESYENIGHSDEFESNASDETASLFGVESETLPADESIGHSDESESNASDETASLFGVESETLPADKDIGHSDESETA